MKRVYIFDIDGVLLDSSHRYRIRDNGRIDLVHWRRHCVEGEIMKDSPLPLASLYKRLLKKPSAYVILATAREMTKHDFRAVYEKLGKPDHFIYRKKGDKQSGTSLKLKGLRKLFNLRQFQKTEKWLFEDNIDYLHGIAEKLACHPVYIHSKQGF